MAFTMPIRRVAVAVFIITLTVAGLTFFTRYAGAAANTAVTDSTGGFKRFKQGGDAAAVFKITVGSNENTETLTSVAVVFAGTAGSPTWTNTAITSSVLADLATTNGGIQLWKETSGATGWSAAADTQVTLAATPVYAASNTFVITPAVAPTLATDDIYYVVLKPDTAGITNSDAFTANIAADAIVTSVSSPTVTPVTTAAMTMDTTAPTLSSSGPATGATNVPISSFIGLMFSEAMDPSTLTASNISMTAGGSPVGVAIRPGFDAVGLVVSSAPTYAASSRFAKMSTVSEAFYFMSGTNPIMPNGEYTTPTAGDIVYFVHDGFPMEVGVITNTTLTSGTFAVNGFNLFGSQRLMKVATPAATGAVTAATALTAGDLIVINTTANPTDARYNWHLVTTGAAANSADLRVDGASAAPTYVSGSKFSTMTPTATATDNGATADGVLAVSVGDLVFAKVGAGSYAWHIATTAGNLSSDATEATGGLDGNTASNSKVAASSVMSKLTPAAEGAVTDSATNLAIGNIVFANTTANAVNNGSYAFHWVSAPGTGANSTDMRFDDAFSPLTVSTNYVVTVGTGVKDRAGNALASPQTVSFTTGSTGSTNATPPSVQSTTPQVGSQTFPTTAPIKLTFSQPMANSGGGSAISSSNVGLFLDNFGAPGTPVSASLALDAGLTTLTITPAAALTANTSYIVRVANTTKSSTETAMNQPYFLSFKTASGVDSTKPKVLGSFPQATATGVSRSPVICAGFSEDMDGTTLTASTVTLSGGITGSVSYNPSSRGACFTPSTVLAGNTSYTFTVTSGATDMSGNALDQDPATGGNQNFTAAFTTTSDTDSTAPTISFGGGDNNAVAVSFSEPMKTGGGPNAVDNAANWTLESPVGSSVSLAGKTITWDGPSLTAKISGLSLVNGNTIKMTASNLVQDLAGNGISTAGTPAANTVQFTVANSATTGGQIGPGGGQQQSQSTQGMTPSRVTPMSRAAGATSSYRVEFPLTQSIASGGKIVLLFPSGFDVTSAAAATAGTQSFSNSDINGPGSNTVTIASVTANATARTITIVTAGGATGATDFIAFDLNGIINTTVPSSAGYTVAITTKSSADVIQETITSAPFYLGTAGSFALTVNLFNDNGTGGGTAGNNVKDGGEAAIASADFFLFSPATGGQKATTNGSGVATFASLASGDYQIGLDPSTIGSFSANAAPQPITISGNTTKNFGLAAAPYTIAGTITGTAGTNLDVFASGFTGFVVKTVTIGGGGTVSYSLPVSANTKYNVGVGPAIPREQMVPGAATVMPTFSFMPPPNIEVAVGTANVTGKDFTLTTASKTIAGSVVDSAGSPIPNVQVFARPVENSTTGGGSSVGMGIGGQTGVNGAFSLNAVPGTYIVEVFKPGMPHVSGKQISVPTSGANSPSSLTFTLSVSSSGLTISGTVKDASGNAVPYAGVSGRKVTSTSDTTAIGGTSSNNVGGPTDSNGAYTLYVDAGTWVVEAFAPELGRLGSKTITITTTSASGQDFSAETLSLGTITGTATRGGTAQQGVNVRAENSDHSNVNMGVTNSSGAYSVKVPAGTYTVTCLFQGYGEKAVTGSVTVTANTTTSGKDCALGTTIAVTVRLTDGTNPITGAFVDARDSNGRGNGTNVSTTSGINAVYTLNLTPGTYTIRAGHPAYGMLGETASVATTQTITYTMAAVGATRNVTGTVTGIEGAWVSLTGSPTGRTNLIHVGAITDSSGAFSIAVPDGSYSLRVDKPSYSSPAETTVTVAGSDVAVSAITLTAAARTISGTVTLNGSAVSNAFVDAKNGSGGFAVAQTNSSGAFTLAVDNGSWTLQAHSDGYEGSSNGLVLVSGSNVTGQAIALSAITGYTPYSARPETITPNSGGFVTNPDVGSAFKVVMPPNALGTGSNAATVSTKPNSGMPNPATGQILKSDAVTISVVDSSGAAVSSLNDDVTITIPYTQSDVPAGVDEANLVIGTWSDATQTYTTLSTTVDEDANTLTAIVSHFSDFAPMIATDPEAPSTPTGLTVSQVSLGSVRLDWTAVSGASSYDVYQSTSADGTFSRVGPEPTTSAIGLNVTSLTPNATYYWKVSAINSSGNESAASTAVSGTAPGGGGGGGGSSSSSSGGGASAAAVTATPAPAVTTAAPVQQTSAEQLAALKAELVQIQAKQTTIAFARALKAGSEGTDVTALQAFLEAKGFLKMPAGIAKGYFGNATKQALMKYQKSVGLEAVGAVGPATRAKLNAEMNGATNAATPAPASTAIANAAFISRLRVGSEGDQVASLQAFLEAKGFLKMPAGIEKGYFGGATKKALMKYQTSLGLEAVGEVGPATRAALNAGQ